MLVGDTEAERDIRRWPEEGASVHEDNKGAMGPAQEGWIKGQWVLRVGGITQRQRREGEGRL